MVATPHLLRPSLLLPREGGRHYELLAIAKVTQIFKSPIRGISLVVIPLIKGVESLDRSVFKALI